jgi:hypothetical protein
MNMIVRINGVSINEFTGNKKLNDVVEKVRLSWKPKNKKLRQLATFLWVTSASMFAKSTQAAPSIWSEMQPVFGVFQDIAMILGALAILTGLIIMVFKKNVGVQVITTAGMVVLGCFLVPAAVMLVAIVGGLLNGALTNVFNNFQDGVQVGGD